MIDKDKQEAFTPQETKLRFEAALRGAHIAGHKPMKAITRKMAAAKKKNRTKAQRP